MPSSNAPTSAQWCEQMAGLLDRLLSFGSLDPMEHRQTVRVLGEYRAWQEAVDREADDAVMWEQLEKETARG